LGVIITLSQVVLAAADDEAARTQFEQGIALYEAGKYEKAAIAFERAYELKPSYKLLYNIGQVQNQLEHYAHALEAYTRYLAEGGDEVPTYRIAEVKHEVERLNSLVGMLVVETDIEGALVFVDDRRQGQTPLESTVFVDLGEHTIVIKKDGVELHREIVKVAGGQKVVVRVDAPEDGTPPPDVPPSVPESEERPERVWTWVALGVGAAAGIGAGITGGVVLSRADRIKDDCSGNSCPPSVKDDLDSTRNLGYVTDVLIGVAAAGIATGIVLFFVEPGTGDEDQSVALIPTASEHGGGLALTGRF
jgi:hypothetical protein